MGKLTYENYYKDYFKRRHEKRMQLALDRLGGCCLVCSSTIDLQFDHILEATKLANITDATNWTLARFLEEVDKCQLLCRQCHQNKTNMEHAPACGTTSKYAAGCRCQDCRDAVAAYERQYRAVKKRA